MGSMGDYGQYNTSAVPASVDIMGFSCRCQALLYATPCCTAALHACSAPGALS